MIVVITKKCPCSYTFKEQKKIKIWPIASKSFIAIAPGRGPKVFKSPDKKEELVSSKCLKGDEDFKELNLSDKNFVCPMHRRTRDAVIKKLILAAFNFHR